jgi:ATP-binding cassette subfamily C protein CydD
LLILVVVFPLDWVSGLLLLVTAPIIPLLMILVGSYAGKQIQQQWEALSLMSAHFLDVVQGLTTLKLFGRSQAEQGRVARISNAFREKTMKTLRLAFLSGATLEFMTTIAIGLLAVTLGIRLIDHGISFQTAFFILLLAPEFYRPLRDLGAHRHTGLEGKASAQRMLEILDTPLPIRDTPLATKSPIGALEIAFHHVQYTYPESEQPTLHDIECTLPVSTCTALVGRSGSGKTTLARLLMRYMECSHGQITVNGLAINELPIEVWREYVAFVPQRPYLFFDTIRENIRMARPSASEAEINAAAEQAGALDFIQHLPHGFDTQVGEQGTRLSAGQAQRIALARAFLKDAPLLILDEPTSSLDPESEQAIRMALERLVQQRTVLVIAHRLNTIAAASQVLVLEQGKLIRAGTPAEWLRRTTPIDPPFDGQPAEEALL